MGKSKRLLIAMLTVVLAIGMSSTSVLAASKAKSLKITTPGQKTYTMYVGQKKMFKAAVKPKSLSKQMKWSSSKKSVATVGKTGKVTAKKAGKAVITVKAGKKKAKVTITVKTPVKSIKITGKSSIKVGEKVQFKASISPKDASSKSIKWSSSNKTVASVSSKGLVTGIKTGTAKIKASGANKKTASYNVKVTAKTDLPMSNDAKKIYAKADDAYAKKVTDKLAYEMKDDHTGFVTAGSDAELRASEYLEGEFKKIGLQNVEKVPVKVDKWQFNDASLTLKYKGKNGDETLELTNKNSEIVSYASSGTVQQPKKFDWDHLELVDAGRGLKSDYEKLKAQGTDVKGKVVLASVDQNSDYWIDGPYTEAYVQGAAAIVTYQSGGYGEYSSSGTTDVSKWDTLNMQDICADDLKVPCLSISPAGANKIQEAIKTNKANGGTTVSAGLMVDNQIKKNRTAYNVIGKIKGSGNTGQQILYAGHYDKYFKGYQDDCTAVGLTAGIAKSMIDAGYKPVNDIIFIAHCAEEWGQSGSTTDWAIGSWKLITEAKPEWRGKTLAIIDFESPGVKPKVNYTLMTATRELATQLEDFENSGLMKGQENKVFTAPLRADWGDGYTTTDGIAYQFSGVPVIYNSTPRSDWYSAVTDKLATHGRTKYHTQYDDESTYSPDVMNYKIKAYASAGAYLDGMPALELDMGMRCDALEAGIKDNTVADSNQIYAYKNALSKLRSASDAYYKQAKAFNEKYVKAYQNGESKKSLDAMRSKAVDMNKKALQVFQKSQDYFVGLPNYDEVATYHEGLQWNIEILNQAIDILESGEKAQVQKLIDGDDDVTAIGDLWSYYEYYAVDFSKETYERAQKAVMNQYLKDRNVANWGDRMSPVLPTYDATNELLEQFEEANPNYTKAIKGYKEARDTLQEEFDKAIQKETDDMRSMTKFIENN